MATVHGDVAQWLQVDWHMDSKSGVVRKPCASNAMPSMPDDTAYSDPDLFQLPKLRLQVRRLKPHSAAAEVFHRFFAEHHYMSGKVPCNFHAVVVREQDSQRLVAMDAVGAFFGQGNGGITWLESRLVVMPEFQGFGVGPKLSELVGEILLRSGQRYLAAAKSSWFRYSCLRGQSALTGGVKGGVKGGVPKQQNMTEENGETVVMWWEILACNRALERMWGYLVPPLGLICACLRILQRNTPPAARWTENLLGPLATHDHEWKGWHEPQWQQIRAESFPPPVPCMHHHAGHC